MFPNRIKYWFWFFTITISVSCDRIIEDAKFPEFEHKLVVTSFISPGDTVSYITVSSNRRIFGELNQGEDPGNLTGYLSDGFREIEMDTTRSGFKFSPGKMMIEEGRTYTLRIQSDKGMVTEASCTVPFNRKIEIEVDTFSRTVNYPGMPEGKKYLADIYLDDYADEENYYRLFGEQVVYGQNFGQYQFQMPFYELGAKGFSDSGWDGKRSLINTVNFYNPIKSDSSFLKLKIMYTDKSYFIYHKSLDNYSNDENPFAEISPVYSNVTGGLGIFAAYTIDSMIIRLK